MTAGARTGTARVATGEPFAVDVAAAGWTIVDLRRAPHLAGTVADRVWRAFWAADGHPIGEIERRMPAHLGGGPLPFTLVAIRDGAYLGSVALVANDEPRRPFLGPWIAALWVEPGERHQGVGAALVEAACARAFGLGVVRLFLGALDGNRGFYEKRSWTTFEEGVGEPPLTILARDGRR